MSSTEQDAHDGSSQQGSGSMTGVLAGVADVGSAAAAGEPRQMWQSARHGTEEIGSALPEDHGLGSVKHFIQRHPVVSTCAALAVAYMVLGAYLPVVGRALRVVRGKL